ncbi:MAG TPA: SDR family oxidoreductase [Verrucomicrobiae bacterium]|nr:SDR family oxidoreductase [Verrucomicrobiae bacterium]
MKVLIVGCGYVGLALGAELVRQGFAVSGLRRTRKADAEFARFGIRSIVADLTRPGSLPAIDRGYDWVVHCVSASGGELREYREVYLEGTRHLLSWLSEAQPRKLVYTSSTGVYGQNDASLVDESSPTCPQAGTSRVLVETEQLLLRAASEQNVPAVVLRVAGIYGPGRSYWLNRVRGGAVTIPEGEDRFLNMIHRSDVVGALQAALARGQPGQVYNAVDHEPVRLQALLEWLAARLGLPPPAVACAQQRASGKRGLTNKRVSNRKLTEDLGYRFQFATFREGYAALLDPQV